MSWFTDDPGSQILTIVRPGEVIDVDYYGKPIYGPDQTIDIPGCSIQPLLGQASMEQMAATQDTVSTKWRFFAPAGADVKANDKARCAIVSGDLQVDGDPVIWPDMDGNPDHLEGYLTRYSG